MAEAKHEKKKESSVEESIAQDYVPKKKLGDLPMAPNAGISEEMKKEMEKTKKDIEKFRDEIVKKFKYVEAIGIVPAQAAQKVEEEYEISEEDCKRKLIHVLTIVPEDNFKEIGKVRLEAINLSKKINDKLWVHVLTPVDVWNLCLDSKFDIVEAFAMSFPVLDKGLLGALRVSEVHKTLVLRKFEKYVTSYVIGGSIIRGTTKPTSDIDVFIIINDTDVKRMPRLELKEKLRGIIHSYVQEAMAIAGVKNSLHVQSYLLTEFWESVKDAHPVMFTFIRDGIPLYDQNAFLPWKALLKMGKIKPSPEAIDMFMASGDKLEENVDKRLLDIVVYDLYWGISTPSQALLMLYGLPPADVYGTVKQIREVFVEKEKILEKKYADILEEVAIKYYKGWEHGKIKKIDGVELDRLYKDAKDYMKRLKELRTQIEKRVEEKSIEQVYNDVFGMLEALFKKKGEAGVLREFEAKLIKEGKFPQRFLENLKFIARVKKEVSAAGKGKKKKKKAVDQMTGKEVREVEQARKHGNEIVNALIEYTQRCDFLSMERTRFVIVSKKDPKKQAEVFFLGNVFVVERNKIQKIEKGKLVDSNPEDLKNQLLEQKDKQAKIDFDELQLVRKYFGEFELVY